FSTSCYSGQPVIHSFPTRRSSDLEEWMGKYHSWRNFILESYNNRFNELLSAIDSIAFMHLDERLENYLQETVKVNNSPVINKTQDRKSTRLNSSHVKISYAVFCLK